jgi:hypothetical protein
LIVLGENSQVNFTVSAASLYAASAAAAAANPAIWMSMTMASPPTVLATVSFGGRVDVLELRLQHLFLLLHASLRILRIQ